MNEKMGRVDAMIQWRAVVAYSLTLFDWLETPLVMENDYAYVRTDFWNDANFFPSRG